MPNNFDDKAASRIVDMTRQAEANKPGLFGKRPTPVNFIPIARGKTTSTITARSSGMVGGPSITEWKCGGGTAKFYEYDVTSERVRLGESIGIKNDYPYTVPTNAEALFHWRGGAWFIDSWTCSGLV
jgi:hypothetical protein